MTKEELRKEATTTVEWKCTPMIDRLTFVNGYITGAEPREKRIEELEARCTELFLQNNEFAEQLTKAKEIIKFLINPQLLDKPQYYEWRLKAEQFLRETDIDNAIQKANEGLDLDKIAEEVEQDLKDGCPDTLCEDCTKDCPIEKK